MRKGWYKATIEKKVPQGHLVNNKFAITIGKWSGLFSLLWYADVVHESERTPYTSFSAFSRRGAMKKATRYIRRQLHPLEDHTSTVYTYDERTFKLERIDV